MLAFTLQLPVQLAWVVTAAGVLAAVVARGELRAVWADRTGREACLAWLALVGWLWLLCACLQNFSGGLWYWDWYEHYLRAQVFLLRGEPPPLMVGISPLGSRPPLQNALTAQLLVHTGTWLGAYQLLTVALSSLAFLSAAVWVERWRAAPRGLLWLLAGALAMNLSTVQQALYPWTKLLCAAWVLLGLHLYLRALEGRAWATTGAALALAAATLVHYSAAPYVVLLVAHGGWILARRRWPRPAELKVALPAAGLVLLSWFGWAFLVLGPRGALLSNTTVQDSAKLGWAENLSKVGANLISSLVPLPLRAAFWLDVSRAHGLALRRDQVFVSYLQNLPLMLGSVGMVAVGWLLWRGARRPSGRWPDGPAFWGWFLPAVIALGIAVHGTEEALGVAHICLLPLALLGAARWVASWPELSRRWRVALALGLALDLAATLLQAAVESVPVTPQTVRWLGWTAEHNDLLRTRSEDVFLGQALADLRPWPVIVACAVGALAWAAWCWRAARFPYEPWPVDPGEPSAASVASAEPSNR